MDNPIIIVGAGPVGLTLALLLQQQGLPVALFEAVNDIKPLGVGINLLPHSVRVLHNLGLAEQLDEIAIRTTALHYYNQYGQQIWAEPRGLNAGYQYPQYSIHRGKLQWLLFTEVERRLGAAAVHTGHQLKSWEDTATGVVASFTAISGAHIEVKGRCLIAADGIRSTARSRLFPDEGPPVYGGRILWRGTTQAAPFLDGSTMFMAGHQDCKFVAYSIANVDGPTPQALINWIAELKVPDLPQEKQDWSKEVPTSVFKDAFADWHFDWVDIPAIIDASNQVFEFPLADRDPLPRWTHGHMSLIGDAAHPMYPIGSNGASQGILDAEKLASELAKAQPLDNAFAAYEAERRPVTAKIVLSNRQNGPEQVMQIAHERAPQGFDNIEAVMPRAELEAIAARYKQTAGFTLAAVNRSGEST